MSSNRNTVLAGHKRRREDDEGANPKSSKRVTAQKNGRGDVKPSEPEIKNADKPRNRRRSSGRRREAQQKNEEPKPEPRRSREELRDLVQTSQHEEKIEETALIKRSTSNKLRRRHNKKDNEAKAESVFRPPGNSQAISKLRRLEEQKLGSLDARSPPSPKWNISQPSAGRFIDSDSLFVQDETGKWFLIAASNNEIQVLALETSLVVRQFRVPGKTAVQKITIDSPTSEHITIAFIEGNIVQWKWNDTTSPTTWFQTIGDLQDIACTLAEDGAQVEPFYVTRSMGSYKIFGRKNSLFKTNKALHELQVLGKAEFIIARGPHTLVLGVREGTSIADDNFVWLELPLTTESTCIDARILDQKRATEKKTRQLQRNGVLIALGMANGQIHTYNGLSNILGNEDPQSLASPRILHWHRNSVSSVKFSRDGNYLLSGGKETVFVLWQLESGQKQFLPHLTSEIKRIVVNPRGDRYALHMGDNSIMVLSTSELKPVANFAGLQMQCKYASTEGATSNAPAAVLHPNQSHQLLLTVPSTQRDNGSEIHARPFLQTFDTRSARHMVRQALTRNNVTDFNLGPEKTTIHPPDVCHIGISSDGLWMASVDEWMPPASDLGHLVEDECEEERLSRREVHLQIWQWDEELGLWTLGTSIEAPHHRREANALGAGRILSLACNPKSRGFATVGEDNVVKLWRPKIRKRGGVPITDANDAKLVEWSCRSIVELPADNRYTDSHVSGEGFLDGWPSMLAYSPDGSVLAVSHFKDVGLVSFIDTLAGEVRSTKLSPSGYDIAAMGLLDHMFIAVSHTTAYVWDLLTDTLSHKIHLGREQGETELRPLLAVNQADGTLALAVAPQTKKANGKVKIYGKSRSDCLFQTEFDQEIVHLLSGNGVRGFTVLFADASLRTIVPSGAASRIRAAAVDAHEAAGSLPAEDAEYAEAETDKPEGPGLDMASALKLEGSDEARHSTLSFDEVERPVIPPEELAKIFDSGQSFALPPMKDMFRSVVQLFARKPPQELATAG